MLDMDREGKTYTRCRCRQRYTPAVRNPADPAACCAVLCCAVLAVLAVLLGRPWLCGLFVGSVPSHIAALKFPVYTESWSADEEERLLEAMEIYGYGSWKTISEHLGTKDAVTCKAHYYQVYLDGSKNAPLPESDRIIAHEDEWTDASGANEGNGTPRGKKEVTAGAETISSP
jgi:hypothetical protein